MLAGRWDECVEIARQQTRDGAHLLDVCVDYVGRDGVADMREVAGRFATASTLPLVLDSTEPGVIEAGLELLGGRAVVNSVNYEDGDGPTSRLARVMPVVRDPETLRRASAVHPIADLQIEYALTTRNIERAVLPACRELGIGLTVYGVFGRGLLTGGWQPAEATPGDFRAHSPRFQGDAGARNLEVAAEIARIASGFGMTAGQALLAWVLAQGDDIVPLVGARKPSRVTEAVEALERGLGADQLAQLETAIGPGSIEGERYAPAQMEHLDSERA